MNSDEETCVVCCREIIFYAAGQCDHHVCYECSTRMRVLCERNECPICRSDMPYVIFTHRKKLFSSLQELTLLNKKYTIVFEDKKIQDEFKYLLRHCCDSCGDSFDTFDNLKNHVQRNHCLFYCELCVQNLKIFTFERKCYTRKDLAHHKRKGDSDDTSHRGHPLCQFCDKRFVDSDELYRHLRREHYFCHFCDADGIQNGHFYHDYSYLKVHFRKHHYLCEEGDCAKEQFLGAFRTEIDYKAHKALNHTKNKTKAEVKQARTLEFEFSITPRNVPNGESSPNHNEYRRGRHTMQNDYYRKRNVEDHASRDVPDESQATKQSQSKTFNTQCVQDFPCLVNGIENQTGGLINRYSRCVTNEYKLPIKQDKITALQNEIQVEDFPALSATRNQKSQDTKRMVQTSSGFSQNIVANNCSIQSSVDKTPSVKKWGKSRPTQENADKEKAKNQSATWGPVKKSTLEDDFPKLKMKPNVNIPKTVTQSEWVRPDIHPVQSNDSLAKQIYQKCKTEKKQKKHVENVTTSHDKQEPPSLSKIYKGFSNYNVTENEENEDPFKNVKLKTFNKIERLRAEEEADDVPWREKVNLVEDDFPPLGPPVLAPKVPPGFNNVTATNASAPPGFSDQSKSVRPLSSFVSLSTIAQQLNNNKTAPIETDKSPLYSYQPPFDFQKRNTVLIQQIFELANSDNKLFDEFKSLSGDFRKDKISASEYHFNCMRILEKDKFLQLFTELLCLLPDIRKQQELFSVHKSFSKQDLKNKGAVPKQKSAKSNYTNALITECQTCQQVLIKSDFDSHMEFHKNESNNQ